MAARIAGNPTHSPDSFCSVTDSRKQKRVCILRLEFSAKVAAPLSIPKKKTHTISKFKRSFGRIPPSSSIDCPLLRLGGKPSWSTGCRRSNTQQLVDFGILFLVVIGLQEERAPNNSEQLDGLSKSSRAKTPLSTRPTKTFHLRASNKDAAHNLCLAVIVLCLTLGSCIDSKIPIQFKPC